MTAKRQRYMKRADTAFSKVVRSKGHCESDRPNHSERLQCAHIISRSYKAIRTDRRNALCLCQGCHVYYTNSPLEWRAWVDETYPGLWDELTTKALKYEKVDWKAEAELWESRL